MYVAMTKRRNYLRMRGEYAAGGASMSRAWELPPHARRIRRGHGLCHAEGGTTSACAENTYHPVAYVHPPGTTSACAENTTITPPHQGKHGNYLRMRGEYLLDDDRAPASRELPPHARRIRKKRTSFNQYKGTTSACAENTRYRLGLSD